jgi:hypothetical protein
MDLVMPSSRAYQVKVFVNNTSLDECTLISFGDSIQPYLSNTTANDPDITGLAVSLKNSRGEILGQVQYVLGNNTAGGSGGSNLTTTGSSTTTTGTNTQTGGASATTGSNAQTGETNAVAESDTAPAESDTQTGGTGTTAGSNTATTGTQNGGTADPRRSNLSNQITYINVRRLDGDLPLFPMPEGLPSGQYSFVFQVLGEGINFQQTEKAFYYLAGLKFNFTGIQAYLPGIVSGTRLIQSGTNIMLEAKLEYDSSLNPYIVWYNGRNIIREGYFSNGAGTMLWKAPESNGFVTLRAVVFPSASREGIKGSSKELSLPVSARTAGANLLPEGVPGLLHWYLFMGDLKDSKQSSGNLVPVKNTEPVWLAYGGGYGLATGSENAYMLPAINLTENSPNKFEFVLRFKPLADGRVFSVNVGQSLMQLNYIENSLVLTLKSGAYSVQKSCSVDSNSFVVAALRFTVRRGVLTADFGLDEDYGISLPVHDGEALLVEAVSGKECVISLGPETDNRVIARGFTAIWDEFAVIHASQSAGNGNEGTTSGYVPEDR